MHLASAKIQKGGFTDPGVAGVLKTQTLMQEPEEMQYC